MRSRLGLAVCLLVLLGGCRLSCSAGTENTLTWDRYGFRITLPPPWHESTERESDGLYVAIDEEHGESVVVHPPGRAEPLPPDYAVSGALAKIGANLEKEARAQSPSFQQVSLDALDVNGVPAIDLWYEMEVDGVRRLRGQRLLFRGNERLLAAGSSPDLESPALHRIIESFRPAEKLVR
jgi:hypothetical protein